MSTVASGAFSSDMSTTTFGFDGFPAGRPMPRLRLTQRGRAVLTVLAATPLVIAAVLFALNGGAATASLEESNVTFDYVTVEAGQSLWQLAGEIAPQADPRDVIAEVAQLNQLDSADVYAGQELAIPTQYSN